MGKNHLTPQTETRRGKSIHRYIGENKMGGGGRKGERLSVCGARSTNCYLGPS